MISNTDITKTGGEPRYSWSGSSPLSLI